MVNTFDQVLVDYQLSIDWLTVEEMMSSLNPQIMIPNVSLLLLTIISKDTNKYSVRGEMGYHWHAFLVCSMMVA